MSHVVGSGRAVSLVRALVHKAEKQGHVVALAALAAFLENARADALPQWELPAEPRNEDDVTAAGTGPAVPAAAVEELLAGWAAEGVSPQDVAQVLELLRDALQPALPGAVIGDRADVQAAVADGGRGVVADTAEPSRLLALADTGGSVSGMPAQQDAAEAAAPARVAMEPLEFNRLLAGLTLLGGAALAGGGGGGGSSGGSGSSTPSVPVNSAPTAVSLLSVTVAENAAGAVVGRLGVTDADAGDSPTWTVSDSRFEVVAGQLKLKDGMSLDHEAAATVNVTVTATDAGGLSKSQLFPIAVSDVNEAPTAIGLAATAVQENAAGAVVGRLGVLDVDAGDTHTWRVDDQRFEIAGGQLKLKDGASLDYEAGATLNVTVMATDAGGLSKSQVFAVEVSDVNEAPTAIALMGSSVDEDTPGVVVGWLGVLDADAGDTHTGSVDDQRFEIVGGQLKLKDGVSLDHEAGATVNVTVTATDAGGLSRSQVFAIEVSDVNEAPSAIALTGSSVDEDTAGAVVGRVSVTDADAGDTHTWSVDDDRFEIADGQLKLRDGVILDRETDATAMNLTVTATDAGGLSWSQVFAIELGNVNEPPTALELSSATVDESAAGAVIGQLSITDEDRADTYTWTVDDGRFEVVAGQLKLKDGVSLNYEASTVEEVTVTVTDAGGLSFTQAFSIDVRPVNEAPNAIALSAATVEENAAGAGIGDLSVQDEDADDTHTWSVDDSRFEVVDGQLKLKDGVSLDHEAGAIVNVTVTATDAGGLSRAQPFAIAVSDVAETTTLVGTAHGDTFDHAGGLDDFIVTGLAGDDFIATGSGHDIVRGGKGADTVLAGAGDDVIVVVGRTGASQYAPSDIVDAGGTGIDLSGVLSLDDLNGRTASEVTAGERIDGGEGSNWLIAYGDVDFSGAALANVSKVQVNTSLTVAAQQLAALPLESVTGHGESILDITLAGAEPATLDLSHVNFSGFAGLKIESGVTVIVNQSGVDYLRSIGGQGSLRASEASGQLNLTGKFVSVVVQDKDGLVDEMHGGAWYVPEEILAGQAGAEKMATAADAGRIPGEAGGDSGYSDILPGKDGWAVSAASIFDGPGHPDSNAGPVFSDQYKTAGEQDATVKMAGLSSADMAVEFAPADMGLADSGHLDLV